MKELCEGMLISMQGSTVHDSSTDQRPNVLYIRLYCLQHIQWHPIGIGTRLYELSNFASDFLCES